MKRRSARGRTVSGGALHWLGGDVSAIFASD